MDSWECLTDVEIDELVSVASSNGPQTSNPWWLPSPDEIAHAPAVDSASHIAYTHHQGRCESPVVHDDLSELLCAPDGTQPMALLLSSFLPFEPKFLQHFPPNADITVCIHDEKKKKNTPLSVWHGARGHVVHERTAGISCDIYFLHALYAFLSGSRL